MSEGLASSAILALQLDAQRLLPIVRAQARRAYVLEISGTPKAGKSSTIAMVDSFLRSCGWRVEVLRETAAACPLPMKGHFFFNTWTTAQMLAGVLEAIDRPLDLVIVDRGFFDALVWLELQKRRGQVAPDEAAAFSAFVLLDRWRTLVDTSLVMRVSPKIAMEREQHDRLLPRTGSVMNEDALGLFNATLEDVQRQHSQSFDFVTIDVDSIGRKDASVVVCQALLERVRKSVDPPVAGVPRTLLEKLKSENLRSQLPWSVWNELAAHIAVRRRSEAETDETWVQLMTCGVVCFENGIFVFDRADGEKIHRYGRTTIWRARHVEADTASQASQPIWLATGLQRRLEETLYVKVGFEEPSPLGIVWDPETEPQHAAVVFRVGINNRGVADSLIEKEFKTNGRRHRLLSRFATLDELKGLAGREVEAWSRAILEAEWIQ